MDCIRYVCLHHAYHAHVLFTHQASNITTVDATLSRCYDERGHEYHIPSYCWSSQGPANLSTKPAAASPRKDNNVVIKNGNQAVALKVQVNPGDRNFVINANTSNSVAEFKALICKESTIVRLIVFQYLSNMFNEPSFIMFFV